jgi:hypothetical protein
MPQQPDLISPPLPASPAPNSGTTPGGQIPAPQRSEPNPQRIPPWLVRVELLVRVMLRIYIGMAIFVAPWWSFFWSHIFPGYQNLFLDKNPFWDQNPLFVQFPTLSIYAANGAVRGIVSGLGLLNIWIALRDAMRFRSRE